MVNAGYRKEADAEGNEKGVVLSDCWQLNLKTYAWSKASRAPCGPALGPDGDPQSVLLLPSRCDASQ